MLLNHRCLEDNTLSQRVDQISVEDLQQSRASRRSYSVHTKIAKVLYIDIDMLIAIVI